jgi:formylglycine-generating enzyme required for sulfatase activity
VVRGGSFESVPAELRVANRFAVAQTKRRDDVGLRVARTSKRTSLAVRCNRTAPHW